MKTTVNTFELVPQEEQCEQDYYGEDENPSLSTIEEQYNKSRSSDPETML